MSIYVWTSEVSWIYVGTTPVREVYLGTTKVRPTVPPDITEVYTQHWANQQWTLPEHSGYKVKSVIMEWQWNYSWSSDRWVTQPEFKNYDSSGDVSFNCIMSVWSSYGYNYWDWQGRYWGIRLYYSNAWHWLVSVGSWTTTKNRNAWSVEFNTEWFTYSLGKEYGTRLQTWTYTFNATEKQQMETLFNSSTLYYRTGCWNNSTDTFASFTLTITYEPV